MQITKSRIFLIISAYVCFLFPGILNAQDSEITVTPLSEILGDVASAEGLQTAVVSPDGETIAWYEVDTRLEADENANICLYSLDSTLTECYPTPTTADGRWAPTSGFRWSPDSRYLVSHQNLSPYQMEPDIWVFDTDDHQLTNYTDDGFSDLSWLEGPEGKKPFYDILPVWSPLKSNELYFFRITREVEGFETSLYLLNLESAELELVQSLVPVLPFGYYIYDTELDYMQALSGRAAISPDGTQMAFIVTQAGREEPINGIWWLDLSGEMPPRQLASISLIDANASFPTWQEDLFLFISGLGWLSNNTIVISVYTHNTGLYGIRGNLYVVNTETEIITPMVDFSVYAFHHQLNEPDETGYPPQSLSPSISIFFNGGGYLIGYSGDRRIIRTFSNIDPYIGTVVYEFPQDGNFIGMETASASDEGTAIIWGYLIELSD